MATQKKKNRYAAQMRFNKNTKGQHFIVSFKFFSNFFPILIKINASQNKIYVS